MHASTHTTRRRWLREQLGEGAILLPGALPASRSYEDSHYPFRQDSHFLYYVGACEPGLAALILPDGEEILLGTPTGSDDVVWFGPRPGLEDHARAAGIGRAEPLDALPAMLAELRRQQVAVHYLPPYRASRVLQLGSWLEMTPAEVTAGSSSDLIEAVARQRSVKSEAEVAEIENALGITAAMYRAAMAATAPGRTEAEIAAALQQPALAADRQQSFSPIVSVRGEVLHNESYENTLAEGDLLLIDSGAESAHCYASDITRTVPVGGRFTSRQRDMYEVVLRAQMHAIESAAPGMTNLALHLQTARVIAAGLKDLGLMKGDTDEAVAAGAHALFFPHGLGHMLGLDAHDMEDLGDVVGYEAGESRSEQFGLGFLRLARTLEPGFVITLEPGVYLIPALIERWLAEGRHRDFICYDKVRQMLPFGGIRIEDDVLITSRGSRLLGPGIPKTTSELEQALARR